MGRGYQFASTTQTSIKFREFGELLFSLSFYQITLNHVKCTDFNVFFPVVLMDFTGPNQKLKDSGRVSWFRRRSSIQPNLFQIRRKQNLSQIHLKICAFGSAHVTVGVWINASPQLLFPAAPIQIQLADLNWFRHCSKNELNSLNSILLLWRRAPEQCVGYCRGICHWGLRRILWARGIWQPLKACLVQVVYVFISG